MNNADKRKAKPPKPTATPTKPQDEPEETDDVTPLTDTPTPILHPKKGPWWKTTGCCHCSGVCKKGCPCSGGGFYCTNCRYLSKGKRTNALPSPPSAPKHHLRSSSTKRKTTPAGESPPSKYKTQKVADQPISDDEEEEDSPVNCILLIL